MAAFRKDLTFQDGAFLALALMKDTEGASVAQVIVQIAGKALQAYYDHTGQPLDMSRIKAEQPV